MSAFMLALLWCFIAVSYGQHPWESQCGNKTFGPVNMGIDFVDLREQYNKSGNITKPNKGISSENVSYGGYEFWFLNSNNKQLFINNPKYYLPEYGCWCAWGMTGNCANCVAPQCIAGSCVASTDGYAFINHRLFCFMAPGAEEEFAKNATANIEIADQIWTQVLTMRNTQYCYDTQYFETNC